MTDPSTKISTVNNDKFMVSVHETLGASFSFPQSLLHKGSTETGVMVTPPNVSLQEREVTEIQAEKCNDSFSQPDKISLVKICLPCSEKNTFRALDDGTFIDLLVQSDRTLSGSRPFSAPFTKFQRSLLTAKDCCNYPLMCSLSNLSEDEVSSDTSNVEYETDSQYVYDSDNDHEMTRLDCGHPFSESLGLVDAMIHDEPISLFAPCDEPECNSTVIVSSRKAVSEARVFTDQADGMNLLRNQ